MLPASLWPFVATKESTSLTGKCPTLTVRGWSQRFTLWSVYFHILVPANFMVVSLFPLTQEESLLWTCWRNQPRLSQFLSSGLCCLGRALDTQVIHKHVFILFSSYGVNLSLTSEYFSPGCVDHVSPFHFLRPGYGEGYTEIIFKGKVEERKFLAFYIK